MQEEEAAAAAAPSVIVGVGGFGGGGGVATGGEEEDQGAPPGEVGGEAGGKKLAVRSLFQAVQQGELSRQVRLFLKRGSGLHVALPCADTCFNSCFNCTLQTHCAPQGGKEPLLRRVSCKVLTSRELGQAQEEGSQRGPGRQGHQVSKVRTLVQVAVGLQARKKRSDGSNTNHRSH